MPVRERYYAGHPTAAFPLPLLTAFNGRSATGRENPRRPAP
jgi:hypothetical protein